jgi:hypothetical protein
MLENGRDAELAKVDAGIDRYLRAFETGAMPESICGERVKALGSHQRHCEPVVRSSPKRWTRPT